MSKEGTPRADGLPSAYGDCDRGNDRLPGVRPRGARDDADECLPLLLRVRGVRRDFEAATGRLLCVLLVCGSRLPPEAELSGEAGLPRAAERLPSRSSMTRWKLTVPPTHRLVWVPPTGHAVSVARRPQKARRAATHPASSRDQPKLRRR